MAAVFFFQSMAMYVYGDEDYHMRTYVLTSLGIKMCTAQCFSIIPLVVT